MKLKIFEVGSCGDCPDSRLEAVSDNGVGVWCCFNDTMKDFKPCEDRIPSWCPLPDDAPVSKSKS
jgi:hypothetical protein